MLEDYNEAIKDFGEASSLDPAGFGVNEKLKDAQRRKKQAGRKDIIRFYRCRMGNKQVTLNCVKHTKSPA